MSNKITYKHLLVEINHPPAQKKESIASGRKES